MVRQHAVERVIIAPVSTDAADTLELIRLVKAVGVRVSLLPRLLEVVGSSVEFDNVDGLTMLGVRRFGLTRSSRLAKRAFDLVGATLGLIVVAPLFAAIVAAIRLDSRGPVFFRQTRVGREGRHFEILKFRSMCVDAEERKADLLHLNETSGLFKIGDDPRITRVGRFLRKTSLDELPQLINVWRGDMSLVGPRPLVLDEDAQVAGFDRARLALTPGMTGHWQILGSARIPMEEMVGIDYLYVANWSLWTDVKILLRTVPYVVSVAAVCDASLGDRSLRARPWRLIQIRHALDLGCCRFSSSGAVGALAVIALCVSARQIDARLGRDRRGPRYAKQAEPRPGARAKVE